MPKDSNSHKKRTSKEIGDSLERAVTEIERQLIHKYAIPERSEIVITPNYKYQLPDGAPRQVDLHICVKDGDEFERIYIYECKNRKDAVEPEQVSYFQRKVEECGAAKGFIVGKSFTVGAKAEIAKDRRLEMIKATELDLKPDMLIRINRHYFVTPPRIKIILQTEDGQQIIPDATFSITGTDGITYNLETFSDKLFGHHKAIRDAIARILENNTYGIIPIKLLSSIEFNLSNELIYNKLNIKRASCHLEFDYYHSTSQFVSHFDFEKRGRILQQVMYDHLGNRTEINIYGR